MSSARPAGRAHGRSNRTGRTPSCSDGTPALPSCRYGFRTAWNRTAHDRRRRAPRMADDGPARQRQPQVICLGRVRTPKRASNCLVRRRSGSHDTRRGGLDDSLLVDRFDARLPCSQRRVCARVRRHEQLQRVREPRGRRRREWQRRKRQRGHERQRRGLRPARLRRRRRQRRPGRLDGVHQPAVPGAHVQRQLERDDPHRPGVRPRRPQPALQRRRLRARTRRAVPSTAFPSASAPTPAPAERSSPGSRSPTG